MGSSFLEKLEEYRLDDDPSWSEELYQRPQDGIVYSIERNKGERSGVFAHKRWVVFTLPENYKQDNQVIDRRGEYESKRGARQAILRDIKIK